MPLKKPKAEKLPKPFRDIEHQHAEGDRFRIMRATRELDALVGVSWNAPRPGLMARMMHMPAHRAWALFPAIGMGALIIGSFFVAANTGFSPGQRIIWVQSWAGDRTAEDAVESREEALARLQADIDRTLAVVEPKAATDADAAAHAAALRRWAALADQEAEQRRRELAEREKAQRETERSAP